MFSGEQIARLEIREQVRFEADHLRSHSKLTISELREVCVCGVA